MPCGADSYPVSLDCIKKRRRAGATGLTGITSATESQKLRDMDASDRMLGAVELDQLLVVEWAAGLLGNAAHLVHQVHSFGAVDGDTHIAVAVDQAAAAGVLADHDLTGQPHLGRVKPFIVF